MSETTRFDELAAAAERYGALSLENYSRIRGIAERIATGFCRYLGSKKGPCTYLVPPEGAWGPQPYRSGAYSVSGSAFLPLEPISFGLAVRVSNTDDWIRLVLTCSKNGDDLDVTIRNGRSFTLPLPLHDDRLESLFEHLHAHLVDWFTEHADRYEHGEYGRQDIGFDFLHKAGNPDG